MLTALLALLPLASPAPASERFDPGSASVVVAGVLRWKDPGWSSFSDLRRKDKELHGLLLSRGVPPERARLLLDSQATTAGILRAVRGLLKRAPAGSTFVFYYAGHGSKGPDGEVSFASYDASSGRKGSPGLRLRELEDVIVRGFRGSRVVLMADCCYSGGLSEVAAALRRKGVAAVALTSAEASNTSTGNWTFTQAVIDGLSGKAVMDRDGDGSVTLGELSREVYDRMKHLESQRRGYASHGIPEDWTLAGASARGPRPGGWVRVRRGGREQPGRVLEERPGGPLVSFYGYTDEVVEQAAAADVRPMGFQAYPEGSSVDVLWEGQPYAARVLRLDDDFHFITYPGYSGAWDEWVLSDRILGPHDPRTSRVRPRAKVEWQGTWWDAVVLDEDDGRSCVRYVGYDSSWDECVGPERIRLQD